MIKSLSRTYQKKSDVLGAAASGLCLIHCLATPLLFIAQSCSMTCCEASPSWWSSLDYVFLIISFFAILRSNQTTSKVVIGRALWVSWGVLAFIILNERFDFIPLPEYAIYIPALALIILHLYNQKYCQCGDDCIHEPN